MGFLTMGSRGLAVRDLDEVASVLVRTKFANGLDNGVGGTYKVSRTVYNGERGVSGVSVF